MLLVLQAGIAWGAERDPSAVLAVSVSGGALTVDVRDAPLARVLYAIGDVSGIRVTVRGDLTAPVTQSFAGLPLEEGITRLARGHSVTMTYVASPEGLSREALAEVSVLAASSSPATAPAPASVREPVPPAPSRDVVTATEPPVPASTGDVTMFFPPGEWIEGIQTLAAEAERGSAPARTVLSDASASEPNPLVRAAAVAALGRLGGPQVEPALTAALADDEAAVRVRAVRGLRGAGTETAVQSLTRVLASDADPQVRLAALRALASFPGDSMVSGFTRALSDPEPAVRDAAVRGLSWWNMQLSRTGRPLPEAPK